MYVCMVHFHSSISGIGRRKCSEHGWLHPLGLAIFSQPRWQQGSVAAWTCPSSSTRPVGAPFTKCRNFRAPKQVVTLNPLFIDNFPKGTMDFPHLFACLPQGTVGLYHFIPMWTWVMAILYIPILWFPRVEIPHKSSQIQILSIDVTACYAEFLAYNML